MHGPKHKIYRFIEHFGEKPFLSSFVVGDLWKRPTKAGFQLLLTHPRSSNQSERATKFATFGTHLRHAVGQSWLEKHLQRNRKPNEQQLVKCSDDSDGVFAFICAITSSSAGNLEYSAIGCTREVTGQYFFEAKPNADKSWLSAGQARTNPTSHSILKSTPPL